MKTVVRIVAVSAVKAPAVKSAVSVPIVRNAASVKSAVKAVTVASATTVNRVRTVKAVNRVNPVMNSAVTAATSSRTHRSLRKPPRKKTLKRRAKISSSVVSNVLNASVVVRKRSAAQQEVKALESVDTIESTDEEQEERQQQNMQRRQRRPLSQKVRILSAEEELQRAAEELLAPKAPVAKAADAQPTADDSVKLLPETVAAQPEDDARWRKPRQRRRHAASLPSFTASPARQRPAPPPLP